MNFLTLQIMKANEARQKRSLQNPGATGKPCSFEGDGSSGLVL